MKKNEIKDRVSKAPNRIKALWDKYPVVAGLVLLVGLAIGFAIGRLI